MQRIGHGYDCHAFCEGDHIVIGGVNIPFHKGIKAHSDGDVLLHAIGDALLGAAALGDLGCFFPDNDPNYHNMDSKIILHNINNELEKSTYRINNIDSTIIAENPKLANYILTMRKHIAEVLKLPLNAVSVKATTNEKMGWLGRGEGIAAHAVVLVTHKFK